MRTAYRPRGVSVAGVRPAIRGRTIRRWISAAVLIGSLSVWSQVARADVPGTITNQGRLFDADKGFRQWLQKKNSESRNKTKPAKIEKPAKLERPLPDGKAESSGDAFPRSQQ